MKHISYLYLGAFVTSILGMHLWLGNPYIAPNFDIFADEQEDVISRFDRSFAEFNKDVPPHAVVGLSSTLVSKRRKGNGYAERIFLIQYAIAPRVLNPSGSHRYILGDFSSDTNVAQVLENRHLDLVKSYGSGIFLLKPQRKRGR